jgi:hypothetical protein
MTPTAHAIEAIKQAADVHGVSALAREAGVPYTTVKSFSDRNWSHKNLDLLDKLAEAATRLSTSPPQAEPAA